MDGCIYRTKDNECDRYSEGGKYRAFCDEDCDMAVPSNADRIRAMTDEELEAWYWWMNKHMMYYTDSVAFVHDWLKQEATDG